MKFPELLMKSKKIREVANRVAILHVYDKIYYDDQKIYASFGSFPKNFMVLGEDREIFGFSEKFPKIKPHRHI